MSVCAVLPTRALPTRFPIPMRRHGEYRPIYLGNDAAAYAELSIALAGLGTTPLLWRGMDCPILVVSGRHDFIWPPEAGRRVAGCLPRAEFMQFADAGHFPHLQTPEALADAALAFLVEDLAMIEAAWRADDLRSDPGWIFSLDDRARADLLTLFARHMIPTKSLFDYSRDDFDLGHAQRSIEAAFVEAKHGCGIALLRGLPRDELGEAEFELLTWAIGLHVGVARPQGKASQYISAVRDAGTVYRSAGGRGYSSNADLDFHTDSADLVALACYNQARSGGLSMVTSSVAAYRQLAAERPDLAEVLREPFWFSRQMEQAPDETPAYANPVYDEADGLLCSKWNRNRIQIAQRIDGVPPLTAGQREAMDVLDEVLRRPELMFEMYLQPGDVQILNNHVTLHSRTEFDRLRRAVAPAAVVPAVAGAAGFAAAAGELVAGLPVRCARCGARWDHGAGV